MLLWIAVTGTALGACSLGLELSNACFVGSVPSKRNQEIGVRHWKIDFPRPLGPHDGLPDALRKK